MRVIQARNVNDAYVQGMALLNDIGVYQSSRGGDVVVAPSPVTTVYSRPTERVLFDPGRDANPFFHLFESLWMLAGRDDSAFLDRFVKDFGARFAQPDGHIHGAYGRRWRDWFPLEQTAKGDEGPCDQLDLAVRLLRENRDDRQVVLQMWDAQADLGVGGLRDRPCNTQIYLRVRDVRPALSDQTSALRESMVTNGTDAVLDLTVMARSNDIVWGAYGANAVHFSVLQEYLAGRIGVDVGTMYQVSNNWHGYVAALNKVMPDGVDDLPNEEDPYSSRKLPFSRSVGPMAMGEDWKWWDSDLRVFLAWAESDSGEWNRSCYNSWFESVAVPAWQAHGLFKNGDLVGALEWCELIVASDWRQACQDWIYRRVERRTAVAEVRS